MTCRAKQTLASCSFSSPGASVNQADKYGRTPLHVAAAVDYPEMVQFLVQRGADIHAKTGKEQQTPVHFAARNDAALSLKMLLKCGADITDKDFKQRTALQVGVRLFNSWVSFGVFLSGKLCDMILSITVFFSLIRRTRL